MSVIAVALTVLVEALCGIAFIARGDEVVGGMLLGGAVTCGTLIALELLA